MNVILCAAWLLVLEAVQTAPPDDDFAPAVVFGALLLLAVFLVLIGIGIVIGLACVACAGLFVAMGIVSFAAAVAVARKRLSSGLRALHYQICAALGAPGGVGVLALGSAVFDLHLRQRYVLLIGAMAGVLAGLLMAFVFDRLAGWVGRRISLRLGAPPAAY